LLLLISLPGLASWSRPKPLQSAAEHANKLSHAETSFFSGCEKIL
jgi:hypothetical protein